MPKFLHLVILAGLLALAVALPGAAAVLRFDTAEITVQSSAVYDGGEGTPNPFTDVSLTAEVTSPSGAVYTVDGFFDGDGSGGQVGNLFKIRVFADETGTWTWRTTSNAAGLDDQSGSFACSGRLAGVFGQGPVIADPARPRFFQYREGAPVYLLAKFLDRAAPVPLQFSQTLFSENMTDADRQALLTRHQGMKLNKMNVYLANRSDFAGYPTTPWLGTADANDKARFDLARWRMYERWVLALRDAGFAAQLWFFSDGSGFGDLPEPQRKRLIQYGMARLSGYANTIFTLTLEWQEGWTVAEVEDHMAFLGQHNPWDRLASVHNVPGDAAFADRPWADYMDLQVVLTSPHATVHAEGLQNRAQAVKPLIQEEFDLGREDLEHRQRAWAAFTSGAAGSGTGGFLKPLSEFIAAVRFERMAPADGLVLGGGAYGLAEAGKAYVFYLYDGGTVQLDLGGVSGPVRARWFDPRTGVWSDAPGVSGGGARSFTAPGGGDWTLYLEAQPPVPPQNGFFPLTPCRLLDTRTPAGGPALVSSGIREIQVTGACGIPSTAVALSVNITVTGPTGLGHVRFAPAGVPLPLVSAINYSPGATRANNAILPLPSEPGAGSGALAAQAFVSDGGTVHLILDVNGYFQ